MEFAIGNCCPWKTITFTACHPVANFEAKFFRSFAEIFIIITYVVGLFELLGILLSQKTLCISFV